MVDLKGKKEKEKRTNCFLPLDNMSRTPKGEINYKLLRGSSHFAPVALRF